MQELVMGKHIGHQRPWPRKQGLERGGQLQIEQERNILHVEQKEQDTQQTDKDKQAYIYKYKLRQDVPSQKRPLKISNKTCHCLNLSFSNNESI